jgi:hypothetical protein
MQQQTVQQGGTQATEDVPTGGGGVQMQQPRQEQYQGSAVSGSPHYGGGLTEEQLQLIATISGQQPASEQGAKTAAETRADTSWLVESVRMQLRAKEGTVATPVEAAVAGPNGRVESSAQAPPSTSSTPLSSLSGRNIKEFVPSSVTGDDSLCLCLCLSCVKVLYNWCVKVIFDIFLCLVIQKQTRRGLVASA